MQVDSSGSANNNNVNNSNGVRPAASLPFANEIETHAMARALGLEWRLFTKTHQKRDEGTFARPFL